MRIAMWSGPRNLSTAMMYSFGARADTAVVDEPFYASYLTQTGIDHPMGDEIKASQSLDPSQVITDLLGQIPDGKPHYYQKLMSQHMIPGISRAWINDVINVFLIRHPARVAASFSAKFDNPSLMDIGFVQQAELFDQLIEVGATPLVIDSYDIRADPEEMLKRLCTAIDLPWDPAMLSWPVGGHKDDGIWASHWYGAVHRSTGFAAAEGDLPLVEGALKDLTDAAMPAYEALKCHKL